MKNNVKKLLGLCLSATFAVGAFTACGGGNQSSSDKPESKLSEVYGAYSTAKITRNVKENVPYEELPAEINIEMMKKETEGAQLVVTAAKNISSYDLEVSDLSDGNGHKISAEDISVYHQKYLLTSVKANSANTDYAVGDYVPDMLLPLSVAKAYGENKIAKGENQGITVEVETKSETVPGVYTGKFKLKLDGETKEIPVSVTVWDIEYEGKRSFQSSFLIYRNELVAGEYEASDELLRRYEDFLLDYKVNSYFIKSDYSVEETVEDAVRLFENDNYNSIVIPKALQSDYTANSAMAQEIVDFIVGITKISTPEKPYADYLYLYPSAFDEADQSKDPNISALVKKVFEKGGEWDKTLDKALAAVKATAEYAAFTDEFKAQIDEAVLNIPAVFTNCSYQDEWVKTSHATFCPYISLFGDNATLAKYQRYAEENNDGDLWVYTCVNPKYPNPTFHTDDYNLGTRISGWMEKKYNVTGYLYYMVNCYEAILGDTWRNVNVYETAERANYIGGDGFLLYPGAYYGSEYPFASLRLTAYRDSMDDYDMLCVYEDLLNEKAEEYGVEIDFNDYVTDLYDSLLVGSEYYIDDSLVVKARAELAKRILALKGDDGLAVKAENGKLVVYSSAKSLEIDGKNTNGTVSGSGYKYEITSANKTVTVKTANATYEYAIPSYGEITLFSGSAFNGKTTDGSSVNSVEGKASFNVVSVYRSDDETIDNATLRFKPYAQIAVNGLKGATSIDFDISNSADEELEFTVVLVTKDGMTYDAGTVYVKENGEAEVHLTLNKKVFTEARLETVTAIRFSFANVNKDGTALLPVRTFAIGEIRYEKN